MFVRTKLATTQQKLPLHLHRQQLHHHHHHQVQQLSLPATTTTTSLFQATIKRRAAQFNSISARFKPTTLSQSQRLSSLREAHLHTRLREVGSDSKGETRNTLGWCHFKAEIAQFRRRVARTSEEGEEEKHFCL